MDDKTHERRWYQFSLTTLLAFAPLPATMVVSWLWTSLWLHVWWFYTANAVAILVSVIAIAYLVSTRRKRIAVFGAIVLGGLCIASLFPIWFKHAALATWGIDSHWHNYWQMPHVH